MNKLVPLSLAYEACFYVRFKFFFIYFSKIDWPSLLQHFWISCRLSSHTGSAYSAHAWQPSDTLDVLNDIESLSSLYSMQYGLTVAIMAMRLMVG